MDPSILLPLVLLIPVFYIFSRQRKQQQQHAQLRNDLAPGQRVMTTAGMFGRVAGVDGDTMRLEVSPGVIIDYHTMALSRIIPDDAQATTMDESSDAPMDPAVRMDKAAPRETPTSTLGADPRPHDG